MTPIDYDLIRQRAHRLRREAIADFLRRATTKWATLFGARARRTIPRGAGSMCG